MRDADPLERPTPEVAKAYLDEIGAVEQRREEHIDQRAVGWISVLNAVIVPVFLYLTIVGLRDDATGVTQPILFAFIVWGQLAAGIAVRNGVQWQLTRRRWVTIAGVTVFGILIIVSMFAAVFAKDRLHDAVLFVPPVLAFVALIGIGATQLWQSRRHRPGRRRPRARLTVGMRMATVVLGAILGGLTALMAVPESVLSTMLMLLMVMVLVAWMFAGRFSELGLPSLGEMWRWPQLTAYAISLAALFAGAAWTLFGTLAVMPFAAFAGAAVVLLFIVAAPLGGRDGG